MAAVNSESPDNRQARDGTVPVDGHVHFHSLARVGPTLDAASVNCLRYGQRDAGCLGVLLLTQARGERVFEALRERDYSGGWRFRPSTGEDQSLLAERGERSLIVVCGRQVKCESGLEVTALGTVREFADGHSLLETIRAVKESGALACLPWGFGKWIAARGRLVRRVLLQQGPDSLAVCDNGSRLQSWGQPSLIRKALRRGYKVLPGTDPFPFGDDYLRVGSFGFLAPEPRRDAPWQDLGSWIRACTDSPPTYGRATGLVRFLSNNIGIQVRNSRLGGRRQ